MTATKAKNYNLFSRHTLQCNEVLDFFTTTTDLL